jgi:[ribosomal protein S5]-alanine N-acetyltransferase
VDEWILETARLRLRRYTPDDLDDLASILGDAVTMSYYERPFTRSEARDWIMRNLERYEVDGHGLWAMDLKSTGGFIGNCGPVRRVVDGREEVEIGWIVDRRWWNRGLATEAARAARDYCYGDLGILRLISLIRPVNVPSRRVAEKIGMTVEKETMWAELPHLVYAQARTEASSSRRRTEPTQ